MLQYRTRTDKTKTNWVYTFNASIPTVPGFSHMWESLCIALHCIALHCIATKNKLKRKYLYVKIFLLSMLSKAVPNFWAASKLQNHEPIHCANAGASSAACVVSTRMDYCGAGVVLSPGEVTLSTRALPATSPVAPHVANAVNPSHGWPRTAEPVSEIQKWLQALALHVAPRRRQKKQHTQTILNLPQKKSFGTRLWQGRVVLGQRWCVGSTPHGPVPSTPA